MPELHFVYDGAEPMLLRRFLREQAGVSAQRIKRLKAVPDGMTRRGVLIRTVDAVYKGDEIVLRWTEQSSAEPNPALEIPAVYETDSLLICNKPAGLPVHPSVRHRDDTLANWFAARHPDEGFHLVNRLDRNTSGPCMIAKSAHAAHLLRGKVQKRYYALVKPGLSGEGTVDAPIVREKESIIKRCVRADGRRAVTHYRVLRENARCTLCELIPETGRTHQIRVHMAYIGYPLLGDELYGGDCTLLSAHALHCGKMIFPDTDTGEIRTVSAPLRAEMAALAGTSLLTEV